MLPKSIDAPLLTIRVFVMLQPAGLQLWNSSEPNKSSVQPCSFGAVPPRHGAPEADRTGSWPTLLLLTTTASVFVQTGIDDCQHCLFCRLQPRPENLLLLLLLLTFQTLAQLPLYKYCNGILLLRIATYCCNYYLLLRCCYWLLLLLLRLHITTTTTTTTATTY